jgi:replicative DNA helicase
MAVNIEACLIAKVIEDDAILDVLDARVTTEFFTDPDQGKIWMWMCDHFGKYGRTPDSVSLKLNYPTYRLVTAKQPLNYYVDAVRDARRAELTQTGVLTAINCIEALDTEGAINAISNALRLVHTEVSSLKNESLNREMEKRLEFWHELTKSPGKLRGLSTGYSAIDKATRGIQPEQFVVLIGTQKSYKSALLMDIAIHVNDYHDVPVLLIGFEMSAEEQHARHDGFRSGVSPSRLMDGQMTKKDYRLLSKMARDAEECAEFVMSTDISATTTVSGIRALMERVAPTVVFIDGMYMMEDERGEPNGSSQAYTNISRDLKRLAQATKIPIVGTTQALESKINKRRGLTSFAAGYTSAWGQDCNTMLGVQRNEDDHTVAELIVLLSRSGPLAKCRVQVDWDAGTIAELEVWDDDREADDEQENATGPAWSKTDS